MSNIVYCAVNSDLISDAELNYISSFLPDDRLKKAEGYRQKKLYSSVFYAFLWSQ